jgi:hypothetical protein
MKCNAQTGYADHGKIVGAVSNGDGLLQVEVFNPGDGFENFSFFGSVDNITRDVSGDFAVFDLEHIGKNVIQPQLFLQIFTEIIKAAGYDSDLVAQPF